MRNLTPRELSVLFSLSIASVATAICSIFWLYYLPFNIGFTLALFIGIFLISYLLLIWGIKHFIDRKFNLIYKTIHNLKVGLKSESNKVGINEDVFGKIRKEVIEWDTNNKQEIERLTDQEKFRREFLGNVSHELKTPIFNIQGYLLTLLEGGLEDENINRNFLLKAEKSVNRMIEMVDDLDEISKLESNRIELNIQRINLFNLSKDVVDSLEYKAKKKGINLKIIPPTKPLMVEADANKISQVFVNLIVNSINYGKEGGETKVKYFDLDENVLVEITDNGKGISEEHLPRLFERFYRVDKGRSRADGGSGLGLAIVKHIVEAHQQTINVRSKIKEGSVFSFTLKKA